MEDSIGTENLDEPSSSKSSESDSTPKLPTYARPPWPIWSDGEVNQIDWDETDSDPANGVNHFTDPTGLILPPNIKVAQWVLPSELFAGTPKIIGVQPSTLDLVSPNAHLCEDSKLIRHILSEISELYELCRNDYICNNNSANDIKNKNNNINNENKDMKFLFEGENVAFVPNSDGPWKPWDNIYSLCGAGLVKGDRAKFNPSGRYIVRLYFMGSWRQITVDDRIPLLPFGLFGLPITNNLELWPMLLTKALLKVASLSWESSSNRTSTDSGYSDSSGSGGVTEFKHFNTISCLTGWLCEWQNIPQPIATDDLWSYLNTILPKYKKRNLPSKSRDGDETDKLFNVQPQPGEETKNKDKEPEVEVISLKPKLKSGKSPKRMSKVSDAISGISGSGAGSQNASVKASPKSKRNKKKAAEASAENGEQQQDATSTAGAISESGTSTATTGTADGGKKRKKTKGGKLGKILTQPNPLPLPQKEQSNLSTTAAENEAAEKPLAQCDYTSEYNLDPEMQKIIDEHKQTTHQLEQKEQKKPQCKDPLPTIQETLGYVQEFKGPLQQSVMKSLEKQISLDLPITVSVMFAAFPLDEDGNSKGIPSHLVHPVQLAQVRDEPVSKEDDACRPPTPRWKSFRWKKWAMKKGLIPMDSSFSNIIIKSILSKTPFSLKNNWEITERAIFSRDGFNSLIPGGMSEFEQDQDQEMEYATYLEEEAGILGPVNFPISFKIPAEATLQDLRTLVRHSRAKPSPPAPPTTAVAAESMSRRARAVSRSKQRAGTVTKQPDDADKKGAAASNEKKKITATSSDSNKALASKSKSKSKSKTSSKKNKKKTKSKSKTNTAKGTDSKSKTKLPKKKSKSKTKLKKSKSKVNSSRSKSKESSKSNSKTKVGKNKKGKKKGAGAGNESSDIAEEENEKGKSRKKSKSPKNKSNEEKFNSKTELKTSIKDGGKSSKQKDGGKSGKSTSPKSRGGSHKLSSNKSGVKKHVSGYASDVSVKEAQPDPEHACDEFWLDVDDLAHCVTKLCKFYKTSSRFGSCYILRRDTTMAMSLESEKVSTRSGSESSDPANSNPDSNPAQSQKTSTATAELSKPEAANAAEAVRSHPFEIEGESDFPMATTQGLSGKWKQFEALENVENQPVKTINVQDWQMEDLDSLDSGFYIFSDCWTEQNLTFSLDVLHESTVLKFQTTNLENGPTLGAYGQIQTDSRQKPNKTNTGTEDDGIIRTDTGAVLGAERPITVIVKPWDWRHDCCLEGNVVVISTNQHALVHLPLLPGRNLFRLWILDETTDPNNRPAPEPSTPTATYGPSIQNAADGSASNFNPTSENPRPVPLVMVPKSHFSLKVVSKTPIRIGGREEAQNSMTDWPSVFLRQCDILARSVWALLLTFGQSRSFMGKSIRLLRQSYCTGFTASKIIQSALIRVHEAFDLQFFGLILKCNNNQMDRLMLLALRTLFINPKFGTLNTNQTQLAPQEQELIMQREDVKNKLKYLSCILESQICPKILQCATLIIQRYWRGWLTRRLLQYRRRRHKYFPMLEHQIRKIAILLASNDLNISNNRKNPNVSILPRPPSWAMDIMECLLATNPWLVTVLPHAHSIPFHLKIKDVSGDLPVASTNSEWLPFYRQRLDTRGETNWTLCQFDLQTYPNETIFMQVVDNDTNSPISMVNQRLYVGKLETNELGYTILCYKMPSLDVDIRPNPDRDHLNSWKLRILFPTVQHPPLILSENKYLEEMEPKKLTLYRFSGYYIPNDDLCVCRYTMDITGPLSYLSIRFKASYDSVRLRLQIWNSDTKEIVFVHHARGSFLIPSIRLALPDHQENERPWDEKCELHRCHNVTILNSYLQNQNVDNQNPNKNDKGHVHLSETVTRSPSQSQSQPPPESFLEEETTGEVDAPLHQKYIVGIFLEEKSWPLKDIEWKFVQYETKKFWKKMLIFRDLAGSYDRKKKTHTSKSKSKKTSKEKEKHLKTTGSKSRLTSPSGVEEASMKSSKLNTSDREGDIDNVSTATTAAASSVGVGQRKRSKRRRSADSTRSEKPVKGYHNKDKLSRKMTNSKTGQSSASASTGGGGGGGTISGIEDDLASETEHETEITFMQKKHKWLNFHGDEDDVSDEEEFELETFKTANLTIVQGGPDSQRVVEVDQPHWIFEVLMDTDQKCEFCSNRRTFQEKLIETKRGWERKDAGRYIRGRQERHEFLAQNLVPIEKIPKDPRAYVESMSKFYSCLYLDKTQLDGLNYDDWLPPKEPKRPPLPSELSVIRSYKAIAETFKAQASTDTTTTTTPRISGGEGGSGGASNNKSDPQSKKSSAAGSNISPEDDLPNPYGNSPRNRNVSFSGENPNPNAPEDKRRSKQSIGSILNADNSFASSSPSRKSKKSVSSKALSNKSQTFKEKRSRRKSKKFLKFKGMKGKHNETDNEPNKQVDTEEKDANIILSEEDAEETGAESGAETGAESDAAETNAKNVDSKTPANNNDPDPSSSLDKEYPLVVTSPSQDEVVDENARYCSPPPNGPPTHILFGPPLQKCGKFKNETFSIIDRQLLTDIRGEPWKKDGDFLPTTRSTTAVKLQNWEIEHKEIREGFRQRLSEQKKEWQDFNSEITGNVFCELERNREYLQECREYYLGTYIMRSPGRSSIDTIHSITPVEDAYRGVSEGSGTFLTSHSTAYRGNAKSVTSEKSYLPLIFRQSDATDNLTNLTEQEPPLELAGADANAGSGSGGKNSISSDKSGKKIKQSLKSESEPFIPTGVEIPVQVPVPPSSK